MFGGWSPDSRYFAYGSSSKNTSGLWLLDATTGAVRLLADIPACKPCWSPDGRFIAADVRSTNQIVILDLQSLNLAQGF